MDLRLEMCACGNGGVPHGKLFVGSKTTRTVVSKDDARGLTEELLTNKLISVKQAGVLSRAIESSSLFEDSKVPTDMVMRMLLFAHK